MDKIYDTSMIPEGILIDENMLPYIENRKYGWGKQFNAFITEHSDCYHKSRCPVIRNKKRKVIHLYTAIEHYRPCSYCHPHEYVDDWYKEFLKKNKEPTTELMSPDIAPVPEEPTTVVYHEPDKYRNPLIAVAVISAIIITLLIITIINKNSVIADLEETKQKIVNDYLKDVKKSPFLMSGFGGNVVASNMTKPTTVYEAGELAKNLFK